MQNKYDDENFFEKYSLMERSRKGLDASGEWESLKSILPSVKNSEVLDIGCGYGWHSEYFLDKGASKIIALDISTKMLEVARDKILSDKVTFINSSIEQYDTDETFDLIFCSLVLHYIEDYEAVIKKIYKMLKPNGKLIFTVEHPVFTSVEKQDWIYVDGEISHFPVDNYSYEGRRDTNFLEENIVKYHRTIGTYLSTLIQNRFKLENIIEPTPPEHLLNIPTMKNEFRRPMMLIVGAVKE